MKEEAISIIEKISKIPQLMSFVLQIKEGKAPFSIAVAKTTLDIDLKDIKKTIEKDLNKFEEIIRSDWETS